MSNSQLMNYVVRMVIPIRREFGRNLDVHQFLHDLAYAREVLEEALRSQDPRLKDYAVYVQQLMHGSRLAGASAPAPAPAPLAPTEPSATTAPGFAHTRPGADPAGSQRKDSLTEEELRAQVLKKYTTGLR